MPDWKQTIRERLRWAGLDAASESEIARELADHLDDLYEDLRASGHSHEDAHQIALEKLGEHELMEAIGAAVKHRRATPQQLVMGEQGRGWLLACLHGLKLALRNLRLKPLFSLLAIGLLMASIAGNVVIFNVFNSLFLRPLPFPHSDRLVDLDETAPRWHLPYVGVSNIDLYQWQHGNSTFDSMAFYRNVNFNLSSAESSQRVQGVQVSQEMLRVLGLNLTLGRNFTMAEDRPGGAQVVLLNYRFWQEKFQSDPKVLGQVLKLDDEPYTIIGVLPPTAVFPDRASLWVPLVADPSVPAGYYVRGIGRLRPGVSIEQAQADLLRTHKSIIPEHRVNEITSPIVTSLRDRYLGAFKMGGVVLFGALGVVLLIACVNIATLMMVRGIFRNREMAIRVAVGATRGRIIAQLLTESLVLAVLGGALGVALGAACLRAVVALLADRVPEWVRFPLDTRFAVFCVVITGTAALLFGLAPSLQAAQVDLRAALADSGVRATASRAQRRTLGALIVAEVGLALALSISAALLVESFRKILQVDPGFRPENVLTFRITLPDAAFPNPEQRIEYYDNLLTRIKMLPGIKAASATSSAPLGARWGGVFEAEGASAHRQSDNPTVLQVAILPGYLEAMGMSLLAGRSFNEQDCQMQTPMVVIVNESFAKHYWPGEDPIGKRIRRPGISNGGPLFNTWYEIVGLARDAKHDGPDQVSPPAVFLPYTKVVRAADANDARALNPMTIVVRGSINPQQSIGPIREIAHRLDPAVPVYLVATMTEQIDQFLWTRRAYSWLFGCFAVIAITLSAAGLYGFISYAVSQRTQEIGIRMAVGASSARVLLDVLRDGMKLVIAGVTAGIPLALIVSRLLRTLLFGVTSRNPAIYFSVVVIVLVVGLLANFIPAQRAARVDPVQALHVQ